MKSTKCPAGEACNGTGWLWVMASPSGEPEPCHHVPCACNPHGAGNPYRQLEYTWSEDRECWIGKKRAVVTVHIPKAPF